VHHRHRAPNGAGFCLSPLGPLTRARGWSAERRIHFKAASRAAASMTRTPRLPALHRGDFCSRARASGWGPTRKRRLSRRLPPPFSPTASSHSRQPVIVPADGCPRPPECEVTSLARGRRILLHLRHVSGRRPSSEQDERTISTDCQTRSIVLAQNILHCRVGKGGAHQRDAVPTIRIAVGTARQARAFAHPTYSGGNCVHRLSPLIPAEVQRSIAIENALGSETRRWTPASAG